MLPAKKQNSFFHPEDFSFEMRLCCFTEGNVYESVMFELISVATSHALKCTLVMVPSLTERTWEKWFKLHLIYEEGA